MCQTQVHVQGINFVFHEVKSIVVTSTNLHEMLQSLYVCALTQFPVQHE
jgi:hypothetical protein